VKKLLPLPALPAGCRVEDGILVDTKAVASTSAVPPLVQHVPPLPTEPAAAASDLDDAISLIHRTDLPVRSVMAAIAALVDQHPSIREDLEPLLQAHVTRRAPAANDLVAWQAACALDSLGHVPSYCDEWDVRDDTPFAALAAFESSGYKKDPGGVASYLASLDLGPAVDDARAPRWRTTFVDALHQHGHVVEAEIYPRSHLWMVHLVRTIPELRGIEVDMEQEGRRWSLVAYGGGRRWARPEPKARDTVEVWVALLNRVLAEQNRVVALVPLVRWFPEVEPMQRFAVGARPGLTALLRDGWLQPTYTWCEDL
jgi:hypothetical protein